MLAAPLVTETLPPEKKATVPLPLPSLPARSTTLPSVVVMTPFTFTSRPAFATKLPLVAVIAEFTFTSRTALSVKIDGGGKNAALSQVITASMLISPFPLPLVPLFAVVIVTSVPRLRAVVMVVTFTLDVFAPEPGEKTSGVPPLYDPPLSTAPVIVTSDGSSSHMPRLPFNALAFTLIPATSSQWPEVSANPPSPLRTPPRAVMLP